MSVMGTGGAEDADAQPASRVAVSTIRTAMLIDRDGFIWHNLTRGGGASLGGGASNHDLRHGAAMEVYTAHHDLEQVRALLGHVRIETTQTYARIQPQQLKEAVNFYESRALEVL